MSGKRYSDQTFGDIRAVLGAPVFVTTAKGELVGGHVHHITDESAAPGYRDRVFIAYVAGGGWDEDRAPSSSRCPSSTRRRARRPTTCRRITGAGRVRGRRPRAKDAV